jgi:hypothetical protein
MGGHAFGTSVGLLANGVVGFTERLASGGMPILFVSSSYTQYFTSDMDVDHERRCHCQSNIAFAILRSFF